MTESPRKNILLINLSLLTGLAFFLPVKIQKIVIANNSNLIFIVLTFACLGHFGPHLLDTLQNHVAMPVKSFNSAEEFLVVSAIDQNLCPALIGGMVVSIGDKFVDMSMSSKLKKYSELIQAAA